MKPSSGSASRAANELRHLVELREVSRLATAPRLNDFCWPRGKIAAGWGRHSRCLPFCSGAMGLNRRGFACGPQLSQLLFLPLLEADARAGAFAYLAV